MPDWLQTSIQSFFSLPFAVLPMLLFLGVARQLNRYSPAPVWIVLLHFAWGALGATTIASAVNSFAENTLMFLAMNTGVAVFATAVIIAPLSEEPSKAIALLLSARMKQFHHVADGVVYGVAIGFGFGMTENYLYFMQAAASDTWLSLVIVRTLFSAMLHAIATGMIGGIMGYAKFSRGVASFRWMLIGFFPSMLLHAVWNFSAKVPSFNALGFLAISSAFGLLTIVFIVSLYFERRIINRELHEEITGGGLPFAVLSASVHIPKNESQKAFARLCHEFAFERVALRKYTNTHEALLHRERMHRLRQDIIASLEQTMR
jgi:RsiW-degrading membrane proteinase PrsW (M82 family)